MNILNNTSREDINSIISKNQFNIYQNNISQQAKNAEKKIVNRYHRNSKHPNITGVVSVDRNFNLHEEPPKDDKFFYSKLSGNKILKEDFSHNNMVPFFGSNIKQNISDESNQTVLENHTGNITNYKNKSEITNMFEPQNNFSYTFGAPNYNEELKEKYIPSNKKQQELPIKQVRVGPGINQGYQSKPCGGLNQSNKRDFIMPKNIDQLRTMTNPKKQYKGRIISGLKIGQRGIQNKIRKNLPETYYNNNPERYFTSVVNSKNKVREKVRVKKTNRQCSTSYSGTAGPVTNLRPEKRGLYRKSRKNNYVNSGVRNIEGQGKWNADKDNYGKNSFKLPLNERDTTQKESPLLNLTSAVKSVITPVQDYLKTSKKENFIGNKRPNGNFGAQLPSKMTVYDPNDIARTTIKETNIHNERDGNLSGPQKITVYDPNDVAKTTIKETNIHDNRDGNIGHVAFKSVVYDPNDIARTTVKETNIHDNRIGPLNSNRPNVQNYNLDPAKVTIRNTTQETDTTINLSSSHKKQIVYDPNDIPQPTIKDTNIHNNRTGNLDVQGVDKGTGYQTTGVQMKNTNKQFTSDFEYQGVADGDVGKGGGEGYLVTNYNAKNINRQFIADNEYVGTADSTNDKPKSYDNAYNAQLNYNKQKISMGREPTKTSVKLNVGEGDINIDVKKLESDILNIRELGMTRITNSIPGKIEQAHTNERVPLSEDRNRERFNPEMLEKFKDNPLTQPLNSY